MSCEGRWLSSDGPWALRGCRTRRARPWPPGWRWPLSLLRHIRAPEHCCLAVNAGGGAMVFRFTPEEEAFRRELRLFLERELPAGWEGRDPWGEGDGEEGWQFQRRFVAELARRRWLAMAWPPEYGGLGASHMRQLIYNEEMAYRAAPGATSMGVAWVGPAIMLYGTAEQKRRY